MMGGCSLRAIALVVAAASAKRDRRVAVWASASPQYVAGTLAQLRNASWRGLFDRVMLGGCGWYVDKVNGTLEVNMTEYEAPGCQRVLQALADLDLDPDMWVGGLPDVALEKPKTFVDSAVALVASGRGTFRNLAGIHFDEETECAPRATLANFTKWIEVMDDLSEAVHERRTEITVAVQAMFGIEDAPYVKNAPCLEAPWKYETNPELLALLRNSKVDRWIEMDTYYFSLSRYYDALDWYRDAYPPSTLGVAVANADVNPLSSPDEYLARARAWHGAKQDDFGRAQPPLDWLSVFMVPVDDAWREHLWRWKTGCDGCAPLACFEMDVPCDRAPR